MSEQPWSGIGWCSECLNAIYQLSVGRKGKRFGPCGHTDARLLTTAPIRWHADDVDDEHVDWWEMP